MKLLPKRLHSIDVFRAVTMLLMIFVNDVGSVKQIPSWIDHVAENVDGLGFADTIFPSFLFIVGLSLPFAINNKLEKGESTLNIALYILSRSVALLVMGFFHVNLENYNKVAAIPYSIFTILVTLGFFLIWLDYPPTMQKIKKYALIAGGIGLLILMAFLYKGGTPALPEGLHTYWWGILGIIGWAYFVCALVYLVSRGNLMIMLPVLLFFIVVNACVHINKMQPIPYLIGDASSVSLVLWGAVIVVIYSKMAHKLANVMLLFICISIALIVSGIIVRPVFGGISKIHSTPAWVYICTAISLLVFSALIWLIDFKNKQHWFHFIRPAGTSTLTCYLMPYFLYAIYSLINFHYPAIMTVGFGGIFKSFLVAFFIIYLVGCMEKKRLRLKI